MATSAKILADSISPDGVRLTTLECVYPRIIHAEMMTHRVFSRNAASSRAIPVQKMIAAVQNNPYIPTVWGLNQKGMQSELTFDDADDVSFCTEQWLAARNSAVYHAERLVERGLHKQWVNRLLEPFLWYTCIITATEWSNFFNLRCHPAAHPEIKLVAELMRDAMEKSVPHELCYGQWHLPLVVGVDIDFNFNLKSGDWDYWCGVSVGRCARVSYLTHDGKRDPRADIELADRLLEAGHLSPFEHVARPLASGSEAFRRGGDENPANCFVGNLRGWVSYRKTVPHEEDILGGRSVQEVAK